MNESQRIALRPNLKNRVGELVSRKSVDSPRIPAWSHILPPQVKLTINRSGDNYQQEGHTSVYSHSLPTRTDNMANARVLQRQTAGEKSTSPKPILLENRPDLLFQKRESQTANALYQEAFKLGVRLMPDADMPADAEAQYDRLNNVVWIPAEEFKKTVHVRNVKRTIIHELVHALQNKDILGANKTPGERKAAIRQAGRAMTQDQYVEYVIAKEIEAERTSWKVDTESVNQFEKSKNKQGFPQDILDEIVEERVKEFREQTEPSYRKKARHDYKEYQIEDGGK